MTTQRKTLAKLEYLGMFFRPGGLLGSYDFSMSRIVEKVMNGELFHKKNADKEGADHE